MGFLFLLLAGMADEDWRVREWCDRAMRCQGAAADLALYIATDSPDAEVRRRGLAALCDLHPLWHSARVERMRMLCQREIGDWPWLDSLPDTMEGKTEIVRHYVDGAREWHQESCHPPEWRAYRRATELWAIVMLDGHWPMPESEVRTLLLSMCDKEKALKK